MVYTAQTEEIMPPSPTAHARLASKEYPRIQVIASSTTTKSLVVTLETKGATKQVKDDGRPALGVVGIEQPKGASNVSNRVF